ncbi:uncharacterized protein LOC112556684 isoform X2 [Pomacea canaliculata]|nr:uncharacterized protein LOC112556684 isoform X2 [Pomacea canaliculata]
MSFHAEIKPIETSPPKTDFHQSGPQHNIQTGVSNESKKGISSGQRMLGQHDINLCIKEDSTPYAATVVHPGLQPEFRDSYGNPSLWGLFRLASTCRMYAMHTPVDSSGRCFLEYDKLTDEHFTFFASSQASIARCLYEPDFPNHPLEVHVTGGHIGRTSVSTVATITSPRDQEQRNIFLKPTR